MFEEMEEEIAFLNQTAGSNWSMEPNISLDCGHAMSNHSMDIVLVSLLNRLHFNAMAKTIICWASSNGPRLAIQTFHYTKVGL
jgi:hypothetical protein